MTKLFPDDYVESVYNIDFRQLYNHGYRAVLFDVDNTLVPHNAPADERAKEFFKELKAIGYNTILISNNAEPRVKQFCNDVGCDGYEYKAGKPSPNKYLSAIQKFNIKNDEAIFVGDQIFTDIWGANRALIRSVMVKPVKKWKEEPQIVLKRFLEAIVIALYRVTLSKGPKNPVPLKDK